jgi:hypothetical protein
MNWQRAMPAAPKSSSGRRPQLSTMYSPGKVEATLTEDVIMLITNEF